MPVAPGRELQDPALRFFDKILVADGGCWPWGGALDEAGYGHFYCGNGKHARTHRFAYELLIGPIPDGLVIDHLCRVRHCVNPDHLEPVTGEENSRRQIRTRPPRKLVTHCIRGHAYTPENTLVRQKAGRRVRECLTCVRALQAIRNRRYRERQAQRVAA